MEADMVVRIAETRLCEAVGCYQWVDAPRLFCPLHWQRVPDNLRVALLGAWGRRDWEYAILFTSCFLAVRERQLTKAAARDRLRAAELMLRRRYRICDQEE